MLTDQHKRQRMSNGWAIQKRMRGKLSTGIALLHDNAHCHNQREASRVLLAHFLSTHLASSDYFLFLHLQQWLARQRFWNNEDIKTAVTKWLNYQNLYPKGLLSLQ